MHKLLAGLILSLCALTAQAQTTVTLDPTSAYQANGCIYAPANDGGLAIASFCGNNAYGRVTLSMRGMLWDSGLYAVAPHQGYFVSIPLYGVDGTTIYATASYYITRSCVRTGRGQACYTRYLLAAGDLLIP